MFNKKECYYEWKQQLSLLKINIMNAVTIQNSGNNIQISLNRNSFDPLYIAKLIERLELEASAKTAEVSPDIMNIADEIDRDWWKVNGDDFLKNVKQ